MSVVIPVFNERDSLPLVLGAIPPSTVDEIVVVDNGSTDGTAEVARGLRVGVPIRIIREERRGYGSACLAGVAALAVRPPDVIVFLDGDYSDHPEEMPRLLEAIEGGADLVIGSRTLGRREPGALLPQARLGNALACALIRVFYGHRYTDLGPFRAIRREAYERLQHVGSRLRMDLRDAGQGARRPGCALPRRPSPIGGASASRRSPGR